MISSQWTRFPGRQFSRNVTDGIRVTMGPDGVIYMNAAAWDALGRPEAVEMMYDKPRQVIGLQKCSRLTDGAFLVKPKSGSKGRIIHASAFCMHFLIKMHRTGLFNDAYIDQNGTMQLHLTTVSAVTRGAR